MQSSVKVTQGRQYKMPNCFKVSNLECFPDMAILIYGPSVLHLLAIVEIYRVTLRIKASINKSGTDCH